MFGLAVLLGQKVTRGQRSLEVKQGHFEEKFMEEKFMEGISGPQITSICKKNGFQLLKNLKELH